MLTMISLDLATAIKLWKSERGVNAQFQVVNSFVGPQKSGKLQTTVEKKKDQKKASRLK